MAGTYSPQSCAIWAWPRDRAAFKAVAPEFVRADGTAVQGRELWTIGHSTRSAEDFSALVKENGVRFVVDVRRFPGSRRYPHFNGEKLRESMAAQGIGYGHFPDLGGRRTPLKDSPNTAWRNEAFRGYADYMMTPEFALAMGRLLALAADQPTAVMCAESLWWQCHRALIADYAKARGVTVWHILAPGKTEEHPYTSAAQIVDGHLSYRGII